MVGRVFLGRYQTTRLLGEGGMGKVYLARQLDLGRHVVIKTMHDHIAQDPAFRERFQRETLLMARFQHPYAVTLYDASLDDPDGPCIVMEFIRGLTLDQLLNQNGRMSPPRIARLLGQLCEVLQAAHTEGIIHRDLKPANLMVVDPDTPYEKLKVMDFGLATLMGPAARRKMTDSNGELAVGTPGYMSPELIRGEEVTHRADLYSVGVILYELLCGKVPFSDGSSTQIMMAQATEDPPSFAIAATGANVPPAVERVVMACLSRDPSQRPGSAHELAERFEAALEAAAEPEPEVIEPPSPQEDSLALIEAMYPDAVMHRLDAWMPETIAAYKIYGFVQYVGGEIVEKEPGRIRVRLEQPGSTYVMRGKGPLSWLGLIRAGIGQIELDLHIDKVGGRGNSQMRIMVAMRAFPRRSKQDPEWMARCDQIFCDLRGHLMGKTGSAQGVV
jgi:serine/threonine-protein kinase